MLVRLIGGLLIVFSILELGLYWAECSVPSHPMPMKWLPMLWRLALGVLGVAGLIKAKAIAEWISNTLDL